MSRLDINMGVTYKLKQEIIDFIIQKKKENHSLSCRRLAEMLKNDLNLDVSKSSINAVIKEFNLSNPVGRRASNPAAKNFFIPKEKKDQLLAEIKPFLPVPPPEDVLQSAADAEKGLPSEAEQEPEVLKLRPDPLALLPSEGSGPENKVEIVAFEEKDAVLTHAGLFLVWFFMQHVLRKPLIGEILVRAAGMDPDLAIQMEAAVFLPKTGVSSVEELHAADLQTLGFMAGISPEQGRELYDRLLGKNFQFLSLAMALDVELGMALGKGSFFKFESDTGPCFYFSADLGETLAGPQGGKPEFISRAIETAVDEVVSGAIPMVFDIPGIFGQNESDLLFLLDKKTTDRLDKIELWSNEAGKIWEFIVNVEQNIKFIAKIQDPVDLSRIMKKEVSEGSFLVEGVEVEPFRAVILYDVEDRINGALLTNLKEKDANAKEITDFYLKKKKFLSKIAQNSEINDIKSHDIVGNDKTKMQFFKEPDTAIALFERIFDVFEQEMLKYFCLTDVNKEQMKEVYKLSGHVRMNKENFSVQFLVPENAPDILMMEKIMAAANASKMTNRIGQKIKIFSKPA